MNTEPLLWKEFMKTLSIEYTNSNKLTREMYDACKKKGIDGYYHRQIQSIPIPEILHRTESGEYFFDVIIGREEDAIEDIQLLNTKSYVKLVINEIEYDTLTTPYLTLRCKYHEAKFRFYISNPHVESPLTLQYTSYWFSNDIGRFIVMIPKTIVTDTCRYVTGMCGPLL